MNQLITVGNAAMTIEQMRLARAAAETAITHILTDLQERTGLCPESIDVRLFSNTTFSSPRENLYVGHVTIQMERI
jgi:hypothetical protein